VVILCIAAACFGLVSVKHYNKKWTTPVLTEILDNAKCDIRMNDKKDLESGIPRLVYEEVTVGVTTNTPPKLGFLLPSVEQVTIPDVYFKNPTYVEDM